MSNDIPRASRLLVMGRDLRQCVRCGGAGTDPHHRRRRREQDSHTHEPCNLVTLCRTCHDWAHANPEEAKQGGWIVSAWDDPTKHPVESFTYGWVGLNCDGTLELLTPCQECGTPTLVEAGLCVNCLTKEVCHTSAFAASRAMCGCGGRAGESLKLLRHRLAMHD